MKIRLLYSTFLQVAIVIKLLNYGNLNPSAWGEGCQLSAESFYHLFHLLNGEFYPRFVSFVVLSNKRMYSIGKRKTPRCVHTGTG